MDLNVSVLKPVLHFASLGRHINLNTILMTKLNKE